MLLIIWCRYHTNYCTKRGFYLSKEKKGKEISQGTVDKIIEFYCNGENSRKISGKNIL